MTEAAARPVLPGWLVFVMALACGVGVSNVYFPQALTPLIATDLHVARPSATLVATLAQFGYALGIFLIVPLGDRLPRRPLVAVLFGLVAVGLVVASTSPTLYPLYIVSALVGAATVVPQILIPMGTDFAAPGGRREVVTALQTGLVTGVLLSRAFGGLLSQALGWRAPYLVAGILAAVLAIVLAIALPPMSVKVRSSYPALIASSVRYFFTESELRRSSLYQALVFGGFSAAWTSVALLLTGAPYHYGTGVVGFVALVGAASVVLVPVAGRMVAKRGPDAVSLVCLIGVGVAAVILLTGQLGGIGGLGGLVAGLLVLDVSMQSSQIANQARIFALHPEARSRLNSVYMTCVFLGGAAGSAVGALVLVNLGWIAVCGLVVLAAIVALARHFAHRAGSRPHPEPTSGGVA